MEKKYVTDNPNLIAEWNCEKNIDLDPSRLTLGSERKVWWKCSKNHEWQATIGSRSAGSGCPYCAGHKALKGFNDLQTVNPSLASEWNYEKNNGLTPMDVMPGSCKKVWWICQKGHEWQAMINNRSKGNGCPYCSGKTVMAGINDLKTINPMLANEWNYIKNGDLKPENFTANSGIKVWWKCEKGHEWQAVIAGRNNGIGCPYCANKKIIQGFNDLATLNPNLANEWNYEKNGDLRPEKIAVGSSKKVWWKCDKGHEWQATIANRNYANNCPYCANKKAFQGYNDLATVNPTLANEWNYEKNTSLTPFDVLPSSHYKVWWKCNKGHEWQAVIASRNAGVGCPICDTERKTSLPEYAIEYYLKKFGLDVRHSYRKFGYELDIYIPSMKIAIEYDGSFWHKSRAKRDLEKNAKCKRDGIKLYRIRAGLPSLNDSSVDYVIQENKNNLLIALKQVLKEITNFDIDVDLDRDAIDIENMREHIEKENSLLLANPTLAKEWNYEKNGNLKPEHVLASSSKKVWWICDKGHEWRTTINHRNNRGHGCPYCSGQRAIKGINDLSTVNPNLSKEWNYEKNGNLKPENFSARSGKKVWWKCQKGHEWQATIVSRNSGSGCPCCSGRKVLKRYNDLETVVPNLAKEWNYEKNGKLKPENFSAHSGKKVWWKCQKGHEWQATINHRNNGTGCPFCSGRKTLKGFNDLQTVLPNLANEWNFEKNDGLTPAEVTSSSNKKVWWKCKKGHEWQASVNDRARGNGCPCCSRRKIAKGETDLQTVNPTLASEWNYEKNNGLTPMDVMPNSNKKVWWKCKNGHEWEAKIQNRNNGRGCPYCAGRKK